MSQIGQTHHKILAAFAASVPDHFGTLCIEGLSCYVQEQLNMAARISQTLINIESIQ